MNEDYKPWADTGGDPDSLTQTRQVWGGGMEEIDLDEWNVAIWRDGAPVVAFHKTEQRVTFDPRYISPEDFERMASETMEELKAEYQGKKRPKGFWEL